MSRLERLVTAVRPDVDLRSLAVHDDEVVLAGGGEVFRLPLGPLASERLMVLGRALPELRDRVPVALAPPRGIGVLPDGVTPFTAERLLPGRPLPPDAALDPLAAGQWAGVLAALAAVPEREARQWGVRGDGSTLTAQVTRLLDPDRGLLTGLVGWRLSLT